MNKIIKISQLEYDKMLAELEKLQNEQKENSKDITYATSQGDLSENAEYAAAKEEQTRIISEIERIKERLNFVEITEVGQNTDVVGVGHTVTIESTETQEIEKVFITGFGFDGINKPTAESPFGRAIIGKKVGEIFRFDTETEHSKILEYKILNIEVI